jgi:DNA-binding ferritin-like protein
MKNNNKIKKSIKIHNSKISKHKHTIKHINKRVNDNTKVLSTKQQLHNIIKVLLKLQTEVKFIHWNSKQYSLHMITDKFHEKISGHIDELVEVCIGKNIKLMPLPHYYSDINEPSHTNNNSSSTLADSTKILIEHTLQVLNTNTSHITHRDIQAIIDVILVDIHRFKYLLQMV